MSYSALTEVGVKPGCPACGMEVRSGEPVALVLWSTAIVSDQYNEENELDAGCVTVDMDWSDQLVYHAKCLHTPVKFVRLGVRNETCGRDSCQKRIPEELLAIGGIFCSASCVEAHERGDR